METAQQKVDRLQAELEALNNQSPRNEAAVNQTANALDEARRELAQEQAVQVRIQDATEQAAYFLDSLVVEGFSMRDMCAGEAEYQLLRIAVQSKIIALAEENSKQITELQQEENLQRALIKQQLADAMKKIEDNDKEAYEDHETIKQLRSDLHQATLERNDFEGKLKNATDEIERLNSQVDDLRKEIAVGARNAYKVTDVEQTQQIKQLADQIKANKIKVTDMDFTDYTHITYTATLMQDLPSENKKFGDKIEFPSIFKSKYIEIKDAAEVERFRNEYASNQEAVSDSALGNEEVVNVAPEEVFPELPSAIAPEVPTIPAPVAEGSSSDNGQSGITKEEFENRIRQVKEEIKAEIVSQYGLVKMAS